MEYITRRLNLNEISPKTAKQFSKRLKIAEEDIQLIRKGFVPNERSYFIEGEHGSVDIISTKYPDRDNELVIPTGIDLTDYRKNPVVLWNHQYSSSEVPLGKNIWIKQDPEKTGLIAKTVYHMAEGSMGRKVYEYLKEGFPLATSIGFIPIESIGNKDFNNIDKTALGIEDVDINNVERIYTKCHLLEYSRVIIPSNPHAVSIAVSKNMFSMEELQKDLDSGRIYYFNFDLSPDQRDADSNSDHVGKTVSELQTKGEEQKGSEVEEEPREQLSASIEGQEENIAKTKSEVGESEEKGTVEEEECNCTECNPESGDEKAVCRRKPKKGEEGEDEKGCDEEVVKAAEIVNKPEVTENYIRIPVDTSDHSGHTIRTITLSSSRGIKALFCVTCKKNITFLFDKDKWSVADAEAWVESHKSLFSSDTKIAVDDFMLFPLSPPPLKLLQATISDFQSLGYISIEDAMDFFDNKGMDFEIELDETVFEMERWWQHSLKILEMVKDNEGLRDRYLDDLNKILAVLNPGGGGDEVVAAALDTVEEKAIAEIDAVASTESDAENAEDDLVTKSELAKFFEDLQNIGKARKEKEQQEQSNLIDINSDEFVDAVKTCLTEILSSQKYDLDVAELIQEEIKRARGEID